MMALLLTVLATLVGTAAASRNAASSASDRAAFEAWTAEHGKTYASAQER